MGMQYVRMHNFKLAEQVILIDRLLIGSDFLMWNFILIEEL
jgi:hypothetical protein